MEIIPRTRRCRAADAAAGDLLEFHRNNRLSYAIRLTDIDGVNAFVLLNDTPPNTVKLVLGGLERVDCLNYGQEYIVQRKRSEADFTAGNRDDVGMLVLNEDDTHLVFLMQSGGTYAFKFGEFALMDVPPRSFRCGDWDLWLSSEFGKDKMTPLVSVRMNEVPEDRKA